MKEVLYCHASVDWAVDVEVKLNCACPPETSSMEVAVKIEALGASGVEDTLLLGQ